jgi:hypothetical protein
MGLLLTNIAAAARKAHRSLVLIRLTLASFALVVSLSMPGFTQTPRLLFPDCVSSGLWRTDGTVAGTVEILVSGRHLLPGRLGHVRLGSC